MLVALVLSKVVWIEFALLPVKDSRDKVFVVVVILYGDIFRSKISVRENDVGCVAR